MNKVLVAFGVSLGMLMGACSIYESEDSSGMDPGVNGPTVESSADSAKETDSGKKSESSSSSSSKTDSDSGNKVVTNECGGSFTDSRDGKKYKTVKIGSRCWFAENLNYADESAVPNMKGNNFCPVGKSEYCDMFGRLYTWSTAIDSAAIFKNQDVVCSNTNQCFAEEPLQGLCPDGWRMPTMEDWFALLDDVKNNFYSLQQTENDLWENATNSSGFTAVPAGFMLNGIYNSVGEQAVFWSSSQSMDQAQWAGFLVIAPDEAVPGQGDKKDYALAVRCLK